MIISLVLYILTAPGTVLQSPEAAIFEQKLLEGRLVTNEPSSYKLSDVKWSPDGKWGGYILSETREDSQWESFGFGEFVSLVVISKDLKTVKRLYTGHPFGEDNQDPNGCDHTLPSLIGWSADGSRLLFYKMYPMGTVAIAGASLHDVNPRTGRVRELSKPYKDGDFSRHTVGWGGSYFFSPDGKELMLVFGQPKYDPYGQQIVVVDYFSLARRWLTLDNVVCLSPQWSPSGSRIAYSARAARLTIEESEYLESHSMMWGNSNRLWVMDKDGTEKKQLTNDTEWSDGSPRWTDHDTIQFVRRKNDNSVPEEIWEAKADGSKLKRIKTITYEEQVEWRDENDHYIHTKPEE